jgi:hypothetical protein
MSSREIVRLAAQIATDAHRGQFRRDGVTPYLRRIKSDPVAKRVKIADMLANLGDRPSERQIVKYAKGLLILLT